MTDNGRIIIKGARVNNLKGIDIEIPRGRLVVLTGLSGSGKSSLAYDTLFAEGQRRYAQSLSSYARQFLGRMSKPDVDSIEGIPPAVAIQQKVTTRNPRSTVATTTEIYDFLRLVYARAGRTYSPISGEEVHADTVQDVLQYIDRHDTVYILSDTGWSRREDKVELMLSLKEQGYTRFYTDRPVRIEDVMSDPEHYPDEAWLLVDRVRKPFDRDRLLASVTDAFRQGGGSLRIVTESGPRDFSERFERDGITFRKPDEYLFSFNSPLGACPVCGGLGKIIGISEDLVIPDKSKSLYDGAIACWKGEKMGWFTSHLIECSPRYGIDIFTPYCNLPREQKDLIWNSRSVEGDDSSLVGINEFFEWVETQRYKIQYKYMLGRFSGRTVCHECGGSRLRKEALWVKVNGKDIHEVLSMNISEALDFFRSLEVTEIIAEPLREIKERLECLRDVGLGYLTLDRSCNTLSGGESQRVNLVTAIGSSLVGSMYILDEPSIGLHSRDTERLITVLRRLRDLGNTVIVVEHDRDIIEAADEVIDMGPGAGSNGGRIVYQGPLPSSAELPEAKDSLTLQYLRGLRQPYRRTKRSWNWSINIEGAMEHNLKNITVRFPLSTLTVVTGVSGSGKSSLVGGILYPALRRRLSECGDLPGTHKELSGNIDRLSRVEYVDQTPIGKSSRSNPVTYLKVYDEIRKLLSDQPYAKMNGFTPSFFSFNQDGGRCPECQGDGVVKVEMQFMSDVTMVCEECSGKRFKPDILEVRYKGLNVDDILNLSVTEAIAFFPGSIAAKLQSLEDVGLGYLKLGQSSSTLSGGESQRIKLAYFLSAAAADKGRIMFIFDEPTTGLHFHDVEKLLRAFDAILAKGHSIVVVEHNMDVIREADWVIDLGPEAGDGGGDIVFQGTPEDMMEHGEGHTADFLRKI